MIKLFQSILSDARDQSRSIEREIVTLNQQIKKYKKSVLESEQYINHIQSKIKQLRSGESFLVFEDTGSTRYHIWKRSDAGKKQHKLWQDQLWENQLYSIYKFPIIVKNIDSPAYDHLITSWGLVVQHLNGLIEESEREIKRLQKEKDELDFWVLEKETRWNSLTDELLQKQLRQILIAGNTLSKLLLNRDIELEFDYKEGSSPAHVSTSFKKRKKIFLSTEILGNQPNNVVDIYKALILHELGHFLLHLGDTVKEYRKFQSLLKKKITVAPNFYYIFNILLDEQLERVLRDRTKEWQTWFNRLTFFLRTMELTELKKNLQKSIHPDKLLVEIELTELTEKGWIKTYQDEDFPIVAIQSAEILTKAYGFNRLDAFFFTFRGRLPRNTVKERWLQLCLDQIPANFKTLDIFEIHRLAVRIYRIITDDLEAKKLLMVTVKKINGVEIELPVPDLNGIPQAGQVSIDKNFSVDLRDTKKKGRGRTPLNSHGGSDYTTISRVQNIRNSVSNPEGEPEPPKIEEKNEIKRNSSPSNTTAPSGDSEIKSPFVSKRKQKSSVKVNVNYNPSPSHGSLIDTDSFILSSKTDRKKKKKQKKKENKESSKKDIEKQNKESTSQKYKDVPKKYALKTVEDKSPSVSMGSPLSKNKTDTQKQLSKQKKELSKQLNNKLDKIKESLKAEQTGVFEENKMTPEGGKSSDFKNTNPTKLFPACEKIIRLKTDALKMRKLQLMSKRYVQWLRSSLSRIDQVKQMQLKQSAGKSMMNSAVKNFIIYGEPQIFRNFKAEDKEEYSDIHISFLLDTSASMLTDERMKNAKLLGSLFAECLTDCPGISTSFYAYNQNLYLCGDHENYSIAQLEPSGKTNEAAALHHIQKDLETIARPIKIVIVVTDGLPTACSVEAVKWQVSEMENRGRVQCIACIFSKEVHPAYRHSVDFSGGLSRASVMKLGKRLGYML